MGALKKICKLTEKYQTTVPDEVRKVLKLNKGDSVVFELSSNNQVVLSKATSMDLEWAKGIEASLSEWGSDLDEAAYHDL